MIHGETKEKQAERSLDEEMKWAIQYLDRSKAHAKDGLDVAQMHANAYSDKKRK